MSVNKFKLYLILYANANASQKNIFSIVGKAQMLLITLTMMKFKQLNEVSHH